MFVKLAIIGVILLAGGFIFSSEINALFPSTTGTVTENVKNDVVDLGSTTISSAGEKISKSANDIENSVNTAIDSSKKSINTNTAKTNPLQDFQDFLQTNIVDKFSI